MKQVTLLFLAFLLHANAVFTQTGFLNEARPRAAFFLGSPEKNEPTYGLSLSETLDQTFDSITALTPIKGFNAALLLPDGSYWKRASGLAQELPSTQNLTTEHLMGMGSISKSFVAVTLLRLQEDGFLDLDDSIGQFLPAYPNISGAATVRQLLSHRTGFSDYLNENPAMADALLNNLDSIWEADTILSHYVLQANFPLGAEWRYSNTNFLLAGRVIEAVTGQAWHQVVRERVIDPLGLTHTFVYPFEAPEDQPFAHVFADLDGFGDLDDFQGNGLPDEGLFSVAGSAGCLISTPEDLTKFSERVYGGHLLQAASLVEMETDFVQNGSGFQYGLGTASFPNGFELENWGHDGDLIYKSVALYFPSENMALAVQQNDDRNHDPTVIGSPEYDIYGVFQALLDAYLNFQPMVSAVPAIQNHEPTLSLLANPVSDYLDVRISNLDKGGTLQVVDMYGKIALTENNPTTAVQLSLENLTPGYYYLVYRGSEGFVASKPFVKAE